MTCKICGITWPKECDEDYKNGICLPCQANIDYEKKEKKQNKTIKNKIHHEKMENKRIMTEFGLGTIIKREDEKGILNHRFLIKLDNIPAILEEFHKKYGGIYILDKEFVK